MNVVSAMVFWLRLFRTRESLVPCSCSTTVDTAKCPDDREVQRE
jgi:hypothetical protein